MDCRNRRGRLLEAGTYKFALQARCDIDLRNATCGDRATLEPDNVVADSRIFTLRAAADLVARVAPHRA
jgi:hypothetical protein